ncbi:hypothetical protein ACFFX1_02080 [Dactylosporangium sucinum]|uniref:Uncharacterized protein n=1 Tax=Dactylosporangium sucinum TaxID=1424081 RepID=A0A917WIU9_9ACTN|nr:hypothetical protein [Dactylosporangium sucinum]GGM08285.1 hypothetical protein GCM10007977_006640 [Dactylosporangium sucinum]
MTPITAIDLTGFEQVDELAWRDEHGTVLTLHFFDLRPDLPAPLHDLPALQAGLARNTAAQGAGLIEAVGEPVDGTPAVRQLVKIPHWQGHGLVFLGSYILPKATCSVMFKLQAAELGTTGFREALIMGQLGPEHAFLRSPYAPELTGGLPFLQADDERYDAMFPEHPLTLVRGLLRRLLPSVRLDEDFKALPAFE